MGPIDVAVSTSGDVLVCQRVFRAERFSATGGCISHVRVSSNPTQLLGIAGTPGNGSVVLDWQARKLHTYAADGAPLATWGTFGVGYGQLYEPSGVVVNPSGELLVSDAGSYKVLVFDLSGNFLREWPTPIKPGKIAVDDSGYVYVATSTMGTVAMCRDGGDLVRYIGTPGGNPGQLTLPMGMAISPDGRVYVSDGIFSMISVFTRQGVFIERFGGQGAGQLSNPSRMAFDSVGNLYVVDEDNRRICKFGPGPSPSTRRSWGQLKVMYR
jgi:DNA-binding beta-propeller fold protein YncE